MKSIDTFFILLLNLKAYSFLEWRPLTKIEVEQWYTPVDLCVMQTTDRISKPYRLRAVTCGSSEPLNCHVGMGHRTTACMGPYAARKSYLYGFDGYTDITASPANDLVHALSSSNTSILFVGDSMMQQKHSFWLCQLEREGGKLLPFYHRKNATCPHKQVVGSDGTMTVSIYEHAFIECKFLTSALNSIVGKVLVVMNIGLHYHDRDLYRSEVSGILDTLLELPHVVRVVFTETSRQNFVNKLDQNGYYKPDEHAEHRASYNTSTLSDEEFFSTVCPPISNTSRQSDWRNDIASKLISALSSPLITFFSTDDALVNVVDLFTLGWDNKDCAHHCFQPFLWQPLWHHLADVASKLDRI